MEYYSPPYYFNNDISVHDMAERLSVEYLSEASPVNQDHVTGILYGPNPRMIVNLIICSAKYNIPINVIFLVDTCSTNLYICDGALRSLGFTGLIPATADIIFQGVTHEAMVYPSKVSIIGSSFLTKMRTTMNIDYSRNLMFMRFDVEKEHVINR